MYIPHYFREEDLDKVADFVRRHDFAALVATARDGLPVAAHLLVELQTGPDGIWLVNGHMARGNPLWRSLEPEREALLIFSGPNTYVSPTWYGHLNVPTWNYQAVHLYGTPRLIEPGEELQGILARLIGRYEAQSDYRLETLPADFVRKEMAGVMGFQIKVTRLEASSKLSQNRNDEDHASIVRELEKRGDEQSTAIASEMKKSRPKSKI
jgi:transcriptional regulator